MSLGGEKESEEGRRSLALIAFVIVQPFETSHRQTQASSTGRRVETDPVFAISLSDFSLGSFLPSD
jgi:hypothetical protein